MTKGNVGSLLVFDPSKLDLSKGTALHGASGEAVVGLITERGAPLCSLRPPSDEPDAPWGTGRLARLRGRPSTLFAMQALGTGHCVCAGWLRSWAASLFFWGLASARLL